MRKCFLNRIGLTIALILTTSFVIHSKDIEFSRHFNDSTLRLDYIFGGGPDGKLILLESMSKQPGWAGRRTRIDRVPLKGNATVMVTEPLTGDTLYMNPFSPLFLEWLITPESGQNNMAFENSLLVPLPKKPSLITVELRDNRQKPLKTSSFLFNPEDELIATRKHEPYPFEYLHKGGSPEKCIDIAILAEGFTDEEMDKFIDRSQKITDEILSYEPFASHKDKFNFIAVKSPSLEIGVSIPLKNEWKNTLFGARFSTFHSPRYLTVPRIWKMHEALEGLPYEQVFVVVNTEEYGGGGFFNCYQVASSDNALTLPVAVHEFGHSFAGLADEYFYVGEEDDTYPLDIEPWETNITTLRDTSGKWVSQLPSDRQIPTPWNETAVSDDAGEISGAYEGGGYRSSGIYRPTVTCRMRDNFYPSFCKVCEETILKVIEFYTE